MSANPSVSIVIPTYNSADFIAETLDACLAQTLAPLEIIVVDDGSEDNTVAIVKRYEPPVRLIQQQNSGPGIARNTGIQDAQGEYIKFCDADDILYPDHLAGVMQVFEAEPDVDVVYTRYQHVLSDGHTPKPGLRDPDLLSGDIYCDLLRSNSNAVLTSALTATRSALLTVGLFRHDDTLRHSEDWDLFLRLADNYRYGVVDKVLLNYRWHDDNISSDTCAVALGRLRVWQYARKIALERGCYSQDEFQRLIAGRYHMYAIEAWKKGDMNATRDAFKQAIVLTPQSRTIRCLYYALSFFAPFSAVRLINKSLNRVRSWQSQ